MVEPSPKKSKLCDEFPYNQNLPLCEQGLLCAHIDLIHYAEYYHPIEGECFHAASTENIESEGDENKVITNKNLTDQLQYVQEDEKLSVETGVNNGECTNAQPELKDECIELSRTVSSSSTPFRDDEISPVYDLLFTGQISPVVDGSSNSYSCPFVFPRPYSKEKPDLIVAQDEMSDTGRDDGMIRKRERNSLDRVVVNKTSTSDENTLEHVKNNEKHEAEANDPRESDETDSNHPNGDEVDESCEESVGSPSQLCDTQELAEEVLDEIDGSEKPECEFKKIVFSRGPSIVRSYSQLTDEERKELIRQAFEFKSHLQSELKSKNKILQQQSKEIANLQAMLENNRLYLDDEEEVLKGRSIRYFRLFAERVYKEGSAAQTHFRLAESQFYRLLSAEMSCFKVVTVDYVVNPVLVSRYKHARVKLEVHRSKEESLPVLGFHGTDVKNMVSICNSGFRAPGEDGFRHASDPGWFGSGVYFSEYPSYSMPYIRGASKILLCQVLPGKVFECKHVIYGKPLREGFDSHISPDGKELVIFNSHHILPSYVVHYERREGDFVYEVKE